MTVHELIDLIDATLPPDEADPMVIDVYYHDEPTPLAEIMSDVAPYL